jgi:serine/threonine-protein kinase
MVEVTNNPGALPIGCVFNDRYRIVRCIKAGGMGAVYEVVHIETNRRRALKVMLPSLVERAQLRERFKLEARVAAEIESEHIVETFDAGVDAATGIPFLVMELLRGEDMGAVLEKRGALTPAEVVTFLSQAAHALDKTHGAGIVHRDLKPDNMFLTRRDDGSPRVKILDFGIAKVVAQSVATATKTVGTPLYMSPEQISGNGRIGPRSDLHALAHIAYTLLVGEPYWQEESESSGEIFPLLVRIMKGTEEAPSIRALRRRHIRLPVGFDAWFSRGANLDSQLRFGSAMEEISALADVCGVERPRMSAVPVSAPPAATVDEPWSGAAPMGSGPSALVSGGGRTTSPVYNQTVPPPARGASGKMIAVAMGVVLTLGLGGLGLAGVFRKGPATAASSSPDATGREPGTVMTTRVVTTTESASAPPTPASATVTVTAAPAPPPVPTPSSTPTSTPAMSPKQKPPPPVVVNCNPPVTVDSAGHEHPKPGCMR